tara:strand:+ start:3816 stop:4121 length:306 start_codon:yes stop_codon:yes gene_type:complete
LIYYVDIDGTICNTPQDKNGDFDYTKSTPRHDQIEKINKLHNEGHEIVYWTARGSGTGLDWTALTRIQLLEWGCEYTRIEKQKKPVFDLFIDDKSKRIEEL